MTSRRADVGANGGDRKTMERLDRVRGLVKRMSRFGKSTLKWFAASMVGEKRFRLWLENKHKFSEWLKHEAPIVSAIVARRRKIEAPREFEAEFQKFRTLLAHSGRSLPMRSSETPFDRHYTYHPAWAARVLARTRPVKHVDISSILSFSAIVSAFIPVDFYDFRAAPLRLDNFNSGSADLTRLGFFDNSVVSLSSMHVIEHVGLGRYGDPLDPDGDLKAIRELCRVLAPGGNLMVAVPVGRARIQYNAHRIYDHAEFRGYFVGLELIEFALIPGGEVLTGLIQDAPRDLVNAQEYGCGCYWFRKPSAADT
jgi:SAM-dependent methyltransferase